MKVSLHITAIVLLCTHFLILGFAYNVLSAVTGSKGFKVSCAPLRRLQLFAHHATASSRTMSTLNIIDMVINEIGHRSESESSRRQIDKRVGSSVLLTPKSYDKYSSFINKFQVEIGRLQSPQEITHIYSAILLLLVKENMSYEQAVLFLHIIQCITRKLQIISNEPTTDVQMQAYFTAVQQKGASRLLSETHDQIAKELLLHSSQQAENERVAYTQLLALAQIALYSIYWNASSIEPVPAENIEDVQSALAPLHAMILRHTRSATTTATAVANRQGILSPAKVIESFITSCSIVSGGGVLKSRGLQSVLHEGIIADCLHTDKLSSGLDMSSSPFQVKMSTGTRTCERDVQSYAPLYISRYILFVAQLERLLIAIGDQNDGDESEEGGLVGGEGAVVGAAAGDSSSSSATGSSSFGISNNKRSLEALELQVMSLFRKKLAQDLSTLSDGVLDKKSKAGKAKINIDTIETIEAAGCWIEDFLQDDAIKIQELKAQFVKESDSSEGRTIMDRVNTKDNRIAMDNMLEAGHVACAGILFNWGLMYNQSTISMLSSGDRMSNEDSSSIFGGLIQRWQCEESGYFDPYSTATSITITMDSIIPIEIRSSDAHCTAEVCRTECDGLLHGGVDAVAQREKELLSLALISSAYRKTAGDRLRALLLYIDNNNEDDDDDDDQVNTAEDSEEYLQYDTDRGETESSISGCRTRYQGLDRNRGSGGVRTSSRDGMGGGGGGHGIFERGTHRFKSRRRSDPDKVFTKTLAHVIYKSLVPFTADHIPELRTKSGGISAKANDSGPRRRQQQQQQEAQEEEVQQQQQQEEEEEEEQQEQQIQRRALHRDLMSIAALEELLGTREPRSDCAKAFTQALISSLTPLYNNNRQNIGSSSSSSIGDRVGFKRRIDSTQAAVQMALRLSRDSALKSKVAALKHFVDLAVKSTAREVLQEAKGALPSHDDASSIVMENDERRVESNSKSPSKSATIPASLSGETASTGSRRRFAAFAEILSSAQPSQTSRGSRRDQEDRLYHREEEEDDDEEDRGGNIVKHNTVNVRYQQLRTTILAIADALSLDTRDLWPATKSGNNNPCASTSSRPSFAEQVLERSAVHEFSSVVRELLYSQAKDTSPVEAVDHYKKGYNDDADNEVSGSINNNNYSKHHVCTLAESLFRPQNAVANAVSPSSSSPFVVAYQICNKISSDIFTALALAAIPDGSSSTTSAADSEATERLIYSKAATLFKRMHSLCIHAAEILDALKQQHLQMDQRKSAQQFTPVDPSRIVHNRKTTVDTATRYYVAMLTKHMQRSQSSDHDWNFLLNLLQRVIKSEESMLDKRITSERSSSSSSSFSRSMSTGSTIPVDSTEKIRIHLDFLKSLKNILVTSYR